MNLTVAISCCAQCIHLEEGCEYSPFGIPLTYCKRKKHKEIWNRYEIPEWCPLPKDQKIEKKKRS